MTAMKMDESRIAARLKVVEEHIRMENAHDLNGIMGTFGETPYFVLNHEHHSGYEAVHAFYAELIQGFPDLHIAVKEQHISHEAIVLEVVVSGTHTDSWRGIMATGRPVEFPLCAVFPFDERDTLMGERIYFDSALMLQQMGVLPQPDGA